MPTRRPVPAPTHPWRTACAAGAIAAALTACGGGGSSGGDSNDDLPTDPDTRRVSVLSDGTQGNSWSRAPAISGDGRHVAFLSNASNLWPDATGLIRVLVRDRQSGDMDRADLTLDGTAVASYSNDGDLAISGAGDLVIFASDSDDLLASDTNGYHDIYVKILRGGSAGLIQRLTGSAAGQTDGDSGHPDITADGRYAVWESTATNQVTGDTNGEYDIFLRDRELFTIAERVSVSTSGGQGSGQSRDPSISDDGDRVVFISNAGDLISPAAPIRTNVYLRDRSGSTTTLISRTTAGAIGDGGCSDAMISGDGTTVVYASDSTDLVTGDTNAVDDVFVTAIATGETRRVSISSDGDQADGSSGHPAISDDGRYVAFTSTATNLVDDDGNGVQDAFLHDLATGVTRRVSATTDGEDGDGEVGAYLALSADGLTVAFSSTSSNLVDDDTNAVEDVFTVDLPPIGGG